MQLSPLKRGGFAAACAQRAYRGFFIYCAEKGIPAYKLYGYCIDNLWQFLIEKKKEIACLDELSKKAADFVKNASACSNLLQGVGEDAASCLAYAVECARSETPEVAALSARTAFEATHGYILVVENIRIVDRKSDDEILSSTVVQRELNRQNRDCLDLAENDVSLVLIPHLSHPLIRTTRSLHPPETMENVSCRRTKYSFSRA